MRIATFNCFRVSTLLCRIGRRCGPLFLVTETYPEDYPSSSQALTSRRHEGQKDLVVHFSKSDSVVSWMLLFLILSEDT